MSPAFLEPGVVRPMGVGVASLLLALPATAWTFPKPVTLEPIFSNTFPSNVKLAKAQRPCQIRVDSLVDSRRSPEIIGVYGRRPIYAPNDRRAWLKSVVDALETRGLRLTYGPGGAVNVTVPSVSLDLTTASVTNTNVNISASTVFHVKTWDQAQRTTDQYYRGNVSRMTYFSEGAGVLQNAMDTALSRALDAMAVDLLKLCVTWD